MLAIFPNVIGRDKSISYLRIRATDKVHMRIHDDSSLAREAEAYKIKNSLLLRETDKSPELRIHTHLR